MSKTLLVKAKDLFLKNYIENKDYNPDLFVGAEKKGNSVKVDLNLNIDSDTKRVTVLVKSQIIETGTINGKEIEQEAFEVEVQQNFFLDNMDTAFPPNEKGEIIFDEKTCNYFGAMTIAEARGIVTSIPKREELRKYNIPVFKWQNIFKEDIVVNEPEN